MKNARTLSALYKIAKKKINKNVFEKRLSELGDQSLAFFALKYRL